MMLLISFFLTLIILPFFINILKKKQIGQFVREEGPNTHLKKQGTPTMGGLVFIIIPVSLTLVFMFSYSTRIQDSMWLIYMVITFSMIGFFDDYRKTVRKSSYGLKAREDLLLQIFCSIPFIWHVYQIRTINLPFPIFFLFELFIILAITNSVNLTDGMDGLLSGITLFLLLFFIIIPLFDTTFFSIPALYFFIGSILAFLFYNFFPAKLFMGNIGSFCIGGILSYLVLMSGSEWYLPILGAIFVIEALSDIIQVSYFKFTKKKQGTGKRIFKMAPIHHHFELMGIPEPTLVIRFWISQVMLTVLALFLYYNKYW